MSRVENGRASYRNRWVRTPRFEVERKAGEALSGGFARVHLSHRAPAPPRSLKQMRPI
jgi:carotenoid cleavage dioxygenase-like enzyme